MIEIRYVDTNPTRRVVDSIVTATDGSRHRVGHLPVEGWFCTCIRGKKCPGITQVQQFIPGIPDPPGKEDAATQP